MRDKISIAISTFMAAPAPAILEAKGLGSSVAVCFYDKNKKIGGVTRIIAPRPQTKGINPIRFADTAIDRLLEAMYLFDCEKKSMTVRIFGGASLYPNLEKINNLSRENIKAVKDKFRKLKISITAEDIGGNKGRSISLDTNDGLVKVTKIGEKPKVYREI